jgi:hypothetical protein
VAREIVRSMIERVVLAPRPDGRGIDATLFGALAAPLAVSAEVSGKKNPPRGGQRRVNWVVAGAAAILTELSCSTVPRRTRRFASFDREAFKPP